MNEAERQWLEAHGFELDIEYCAKHDHVRWYTIPIVKVPYEIPPTRPLETHPFFVTLTECEITEGKCHARLLIIGFHVVEPAKVTIDITGYKTTYIPREERVFRYAIVKLGDEEWNRAVFAWNRFAEKKYYDGYYMMEKPT